MPTAEQAAETPCPAGEVGLPDKVYDSATFDFDSSADSLRDRCQKCDVGTWSDATGKEHSEQ